MNNKKVFIVILVLLCVSIGIFCFVDKKGKQNVELPYDQEDVTGEAKGEDSESISWDDLNSYENDKDVDNSTNQSELTQQSEQGGLTDDSVEKKEEKEQYTDGNSNENSDSSESGGSNTGDKDESIEDGLITGDDQTDKYGPIRQ